MPFRELTRYRLRKHKPSHSLVVPHVHVEQPAPSSLQKALSIIREARLDRDEEEATIRRLFRDDMLQKCQALGYFRET
jgi:hypothetical protein